MTAVAEFLRELEADPERVRSLTWWDWIKAAVQQLPFNYAPVRHDHSDLVLF
jgi:hypothetical protein